MRWSDTHRERQARSNSEKSCQCRPRAARERVRPDPTFRGDDPFFASDHVAAQLRGWRRCGNLDLDRFDLSVYRLGRVDLFHPGAGACDQTIWRGTELNAVSRSADFCFAYLCGLPVRRCLLG